MEFNVRTFDELTKDELYRILQLRAAVFVVEQECAYQDVDGKDQKAFHVLCQERGKLLAYTRIFRPGDYFEKASIGRVVVDRSSRDRGLGEKIMKVSVDFLVEELSEKTMELSAQTYLLRFYENLGFQSVGDTYLEDGIPHIKMVYPSKF